ncbi:unnamed protein product [Phytomonas sp. EM1]|nr:unnamed protein product [Phytomonas sp. EM1]|eukprot:CCW65105.1 unnamed protein product [Phytomonas sp. isolate EM1]
MSLETWAVAAVAIVDSAGTPLIIRTFLSSPSVLNSPEFPLQAHLYVGPEDIIGLHFLLFSSLDRSEELVAAKKQHIRGAASTATASQGGSEPGQGSTNPDNSKPSGLSSAVPKEESDLVLSSAGASSTHVSTNVKTSFSAAASTQRLVTSTTDIRFLGKLIHSYRFLSYGFCSATGITTLLVTVGSEAPPDAVVPLCRAIYECASAALCNPFRTPAQCWRAQLKLLEDSYATNVVSQQEKEVPDVASRTPESAFDGVGKPDHSEALKLPFKIDLGLPSGSQEFSWPRSAPTPASISQEPTLALSKTFNRQLESILSTFTVTSRSCIIH